MKVMAVCAGRKNGNGEILAKEALAAAQAWATWSVDASFSVAMVSPVNA